MERWTHSVETRRLAEPDLAKIIELQNVVWGELADPNLYYPLSSREIEEMLEEKGLSRGAFLPGEQLIGYAAMRFPGNAADNLGRGRELDARELLQVAHIEAGLVHPLFRKRGLQRLLYSEGINETRAAGRFRYLFSTVACNNYDALSNSLQLGMLIGDLSLKYEGYLRYVLFQDLQEPAVLDLDQICTLEIGAREEQEGLIKRGFWGFKLERKYKPVRLCYCKIKNDYPKPLLKI